VISGTLNMGVGEKFDRSKTNPLPAGRVAVVPSTVPHFSWTAEDSIVQVHGIGPLIINYVNPADAPRTAK
jgi:hypothetical protein